MNISIIMKKLLDESKEVKTNQEYRVGYIDGVMDLYNDIEKGRIQIENKKSG